MQAGIKKSNKTKTMIYTNGCIKFYLGDNKNVLNLLDIDISKSIFVTDPPFNIGYHYSTYKDKMNNQDYLQWLYNMFNNTNHVLIHYPENLHEYSIKLGLAPKKVISWIYNSNTSKQHRDIAFYNIMPDMKKVGQEYKNPNDKRIAKRIAEGKTARLYDWWNINQVKNISKEKTNHPCQMPLKIMENIIGILPNDYTIIDPFMGSGTTAMACKKLNRNFIGIEIDNQYFEIAKNRIEKL